MARSPLALLAVVLLQAPLFAGAESFFEERIKDFGNVPRGPMLTHYFRLTNNTNQTWTISGTRVSCGCTSSQALSNIIPPGQSTAILAQMDTRRFVGSKVVTIYVSFAAPQFQEVTLQVQAYGRDDFSITPDTMGFATVRKGSEPRASVQLTFLTDPNWKVMNPTCESHFVKPSVQEIRRNGSEVVYEVAATLRKDLPIGKWFTDVWVQTSSPSMPRIRIPLTVEVQPAITISPASVQFSEVATGKKAEQKIMIRGEKPFSILAIEGTDTTLKVESKLNEPKPIHVLVVTLESRDTGVVNKTLKIKTDSGEPEVSISVTGRIVSLKNVSNTTNP
jgi:hypothetical protein